jgi:hypothetical protein
MIGVMSNELVMLWKEVVVAYFKALFRNFLGSTEETTTTFGQDGRSNGQDLDPEPNYAKQDANNSTMT